VVSFVRSNGAALLGHEPTVIPVSARLALRAKLAAPTTASDSGNRNSGGGGGGTGLSNDGSVEGPAGRGPGAATGEALAVKLTERRAPELGAGSRAWDESR
jgi:hypothetical protein